MMVVAVAAADGFYLENSPTMIRSFILKHGEDACKAFSTVIISISIGSTVAFVVFNCRLFTCTHILSVRLYVRVEARCSPSYATLYLFKRRPSKLIRNTKANGDLRGKRRRRPLYVIFLLF